MKKLFIIGSGGFSKQVIEIVEKLNKNLPTYELVGIIDDDESKLDTSVLGYKIIGSTEKLKEKAEKDSVYAVVAIADGLIREKIVKKLSFVNWVNLIHPNTTISRHIKLGKGNIICAGTVINPECTIGNHCHFNIGSTFGHDVVVGNYVTVMPGSNISGNVILESNSMVGTGAVIVQDLRVAEKVIIGAGATVINNIDEKSTYVGNPARKIS